MVLNPSISSSVKEEPTNGLAFLRLTGHGAGEVEGSASILGELRHEVRK
jgi:hypothetical protein